MTRLSATTHMKARVFLGLSYSADRRREADRPAWGYPDSAVGAVLSWVGFAAGRAVVRRVAFCAAREEVLPAVSYDLAALFFQLEEQRIA